MEHTTLYETNAPRVYLVRDHALGERARSALLDLLRAASRGGAIAVVLELEGAREVDPGAAAFWMAAVQDRLADVAVIAVVSGSASMRLATLAFSAMVGLRHLPVEVRAHGTGGAAIGWAAEALVRATAARRLAGAARV